MYFDTTHCNILSHKIIIIESGIEAKHVEYGEGCAMRDWDQIRIRIRIRNESESASGGHTMTEMG